LRVVWYEIALEKVEAGLELLEVDGRMQRVRCLCVVVQSGGEFWVNVTGNGTATLSDINTCALELAAYVRNPANWISDSDYHFTKFLRNDDVQFNRVNNLEDCAEQYISSTDHQLTLYVRGWVCPLSTGAVVGAAPPHVLASLTTVSFVVALSYVVQLIITIRPR